MEKSNLYTDIKVIKIDDIDVNEILVCKEKPYGSKNSYKYFIGYNDGDAIKPLCIKLSKIIGYVRNFDGNRAMSFKISDSKLLKKYNRIWKRVEEFLKNIIW